MTDLVNAGYNDGLGTTANPAIPANPTIPRPMKPFSSLGRRWASVPDSAQEGATAGAETAFENIGNPANFITKPLGEVGQAAVPVDADQLVGVAEQPDRQQKLRPRHRRPPTGSSNSERPKPLKKISDDFNSSLKKFADSLHKKAPAAPENENDDTE